jgi:hypothetical protein
MITATKMVKLQYACDAQLTMNWPSFSCHSPVEKRRHRPLNCSWFIDIGTHITNDKMKADK